MFDTTKKTHAYTVKFESFVLKDVADRYIRGQYTIFKTTIFIKHIVEMDSTSGTRLMGIQIKSQE